MSEQQFPIEWITTSEAAELSGYTSANIRHALVSGALPGKKKGRDWFIRKNDVLEYIKIMRELGTKKFTPRKYYQQSVPQSHE